jgi:hypothetical protein
VKGLSPPIADACAGIDELVEAGAAGEHAEGLYTIWTRKLELRPRDYGPAEVRAVRIKLSWASPLLPPISSIMTGASALRFSSLCFARSYERVAASNAVKRRAAAASVARCAEPIRS